ncbi:MFS monocarboxylate transporter [Polyplosphaeria fusca]|uniref:MFS monocarboxylate transporter n=1 Tax=Polyplosphaeria fusca TaxID=682080 RepID=A0A9P4UY86_9PLEO|nr:MFS monocarboxylate transporter [Polyplosphaeria fusca]
MTKTEAVASTPTRLATIPPPPDGGFRAWSQVFAGHLVIFNTWGYINSFGIFQPYYVSHLALPASTISWIGSLQILLVYLLGPFSGHAIDRGYFRITITVGLLLQVVGMVTTSFCKEYWQLLLAQGACQGLGNGMLFCPTIALVSTYFSTKRTIAVSTMACGAATGGMVFPAIARQLLPQIGFGWTVRVMALVALCNAVIVVCVVRTRIPKRDTVSLVEWSAFREPAYLLFACGSFFAFWAVYFCYYFVSNSHGHRVRLHSAPLTPLQIRQFAKDILNTDEDLSFSILLILNGMGVPGRLIPALIADRLLGPVYTYAAVVLCAAIVLFGWIGVSSTPGLIAFTVVYGFFGGGVQSLFPAALTSLTTDLSKAGIRIGMMFCVISVASLTGPPIAGALIQKGGDGYMGAQVWGGLSMVVGSGFLVGARMVGRGKEE